ncbi:hypothetical protein GQ44DRAFT_699515 [Phaeosphaeriaceae sp. PMI808]|nr:hypothetical protein GQ44DRAFT_699515 [Phaeosphaeriaceae sp. PMI808]
MPRQLPWLKQGDRSRKQLLERQFTTDITSDDDDKFFDGTVLANKGKVKADRVENAGDDIPDLPVESTPACIKDPVRKKTSMRAPSSSPPPIHNDAQPQVEYMYKGTSKFDLRDDEWMMVEDEFLETARLFTRHMHIVEYEKLKERIEAKKKEEVEASRPVVVNANMSIEGKMKQKAKVQEKRQRQAIRDVFASQQDSEEDDTEKGDHPFAHQPRKLKMNLKPRSTTTTAHDTDSDDLDGSRSVPKRPYCRPSVHKPIPTNISPISGSSETGKRPVLPTQPTHVPTTFAKPALPATSTSKYRANTSRRSRLTPFDMLDDYVPRANLVTAPLGPAASVTASSSTRSASESTHVIADIAEGWGSGSGINKATTKRIAKRKVEREGKRKDIKLEDIPTFLI